jgi:sec-independent protein translocase protein TatA
MSLGVWEIAILLLILGIVFGAGRLPRIMGDLGKGFASFKKGMQPDDAPPAPPAEPAAVPPPRLEGPAVVAPQEPTRR